MNTSINWKNIVIMLIVGLIGFYAYYHHKYSIVLTPIAGCTEYSMGDVKANIGDNFTIYDDKKVTISAGGDNGILLTFRKNKNDEYRVVELYYFSNGLTTDNSTLTNNTQKQICDELKANI